jgi:hypothetical protein
MGDSRERDRRRRRTFACCVTVESQECFRFCEEEEEEVGCTVDGKMTQKRRKMENGNRRKWLRGVFRVIGLG